MRVSHLSGARTLDTSDVLIRRDGWREFLILNLWPRPAVLNFATVCPIVLMWSKLDNIPREL